MVHPHLQTIEAWLLRGLVRNRLYTDDTYQFCPAAKRATAQLQKRRGASDPGDAAMQEALLGCLSTALQCVCAVWSGPPSLRPGGATEHERQVNVRARCGVPGLQGQSAG